MRCCSTDFLISATRHFGLYIVEMFNAMSSPNGTRTAVLRGHISDDDV